MRLLLDTHVVLWLLSTPDRIRTETLDALGDRRNELFVSAISAFELSNKVRLGKLATAETVVLSWPERVADLGASDLPIEGADAILAGMLPWEHRDPFDRLLAAQAIRRSMALVTADNAFTDLSGLKLLRC